VAEEEEGGGSDGSNVGESSMGNDGASSVHPVGEFPYEDNVGYPPGLSEYRSSGANGESTSGYLTGGVPADDRTDSLPGRAQSLRRARLGWWGRFARVFRRRSSLEYCEGCNECRGVGLE